MLFFPWRPVSLPECTSYKQIYIYNIYIYIYSELVTCFGDFEVAIT